CEQKVLHVADDMLGLPPDRHRVAASAGQRLRQYPVRIEAVAILLERSHLDIGAEANRSLVRLQRAGEKRKERGLAAAVRADNANAVGAIDAGGEVLHDGAAVIGLADILRLDDESAGLVGFRHAD